MITKEQIKEASNLLCEAEKELILTMEDILSNFNKDLDSLVEKIPTDPLPMTPAFQALYRLKSMATSQFTYELVNLKNQYNLNEPNQSAV